MICASVRRYVNYMCTYIMCAQHFYPTYPYIQDTPVARIFTYSRYKMSKPEYSK